MGRTQPSPWRLCYSSKGEWYEGGIRWIYGSVTEYRMHNRGWRSMYCITKHDAFRGTAPINPTKPFFSQDWTPIDEAQDWIVALLLEDYRNRLLTDCQTTSCIRKRAVMVLRGEAIGFPRLVVVPPSDSSSLHRRKRSLLGIY
ncbi:hypothetical protein Q3G72_012421 [Acer saccharum]|nr:hypothetical protein Q3G72_012421 [Acer saccharum]